MPIDGCPHSFSELVDKVLPDHMVRLKLAMQNPHGLSSFARKGIGVSAIARQLNYEADFPGCYVLLENNKPFYVGISRGVIARLRQHTTGKTHFDASLAFTMAKGKIAWNGKRQDAMKDAAFLAVFQEAQSHLHNCHVAAVKIENDLEIYLFEAFAAITLDTCMWNTFRTH